MTSYLWGGDWVLLGLTDGNEEATRLMSAELERPRAEGPANAFSVDVEDYFQVRSFASLVPRSAWDSYEARFGRSTRVLLDLLQRFGVKGTFFVLGWNAQKDPSLVKEICGSGHEVASHGWDHALVYEQSRSQFREDVTRAKSMLEDISGTAVVGFRAPSYSITSRSLWALDVLAETGHLYDSSIFPIHRGVYGIPSERTVPHTREAGGRRIVEFPMSTARLGWWNLPLGSGAYLRAMPLLLTRALVRSLNRRGIPAVVSVHPWEVDPSQPRMCSFVRRPNHYVNLAGTSSKLQALLRAFRFAPLVRVLETLGLLHPASL